MQKIKVIELISKLNEYAPDDHVIVYGDGVGILKGESDEVLQAILVSEKNELQDAGRGACTYCSTCSNFKWDKDKLRCTCRHGKTNHLKT